MRMRVDITLTPSRDWHPNDPNEKSLIGNIYATKRS